MHFRTAVHEVDSITIEVPETLSLESMPKPDINFESKYGKYKMQIVSEGSTYKIYRNLEIYKGKCPAAEYEEIKEFMHQVRKMDNAKLVLKGSS